MNLEPLLNSNEAALRFTGKMTGLVFSPYHWTQRQSPMKGLDIAFFDKWVKEQIKLLGDIRNQTTIFKTILKTFL